jgi:DNA-binding GntR family transcriptional regulator
MAPSRRTPYESIKHAILTAELEPGQQLVETELAARYQVSRTPVREALLRLEQDGLVTKLDRTLYVRKRSPEEILDIYETRIVLESYAARLAADRRTSSDLMMLTHLCDRMTARRPDDPHAMAGANREFHRRVWQCSRSDTLIDLLERLDLHLSRYPATTLAYPGRWEESNAEHTELVAAMSRRDVETAGALATAHFTAARDIRLRLWREEAS